MSGLPRCGGPGDDGEIRARAVDLLARREHSRQELASKLARHGFGGGALAAVLDDLERDGLLSDRRFADAYVASRAERGFGPLRILDELRQRGIERDAGREACACADGAWEERARRARRKRFGDAPPRDFEERARQARFLDRRGFSRAQVVAALGGDPEVPC